MRTLGEFWKTNYELHAENFEEMLKIWKKFLKNFRLTLQKYFEYFYEISEKFQKVVRKISE